MPPKKVTAKPKAKAKGKTSKKTAQSYVTKPNTYFQNGNEGTGGRLIIVESPGKIAKIQSFLPKSDLVVASVGHIRDIHSTKEHKYGVDLEHDFAPIYQVSSERDAVIKKMRSLMKGRTVVLAADQDREGEAIAESCRDVLNLQGGQYFRITFNQITKTAILNAMAQPGDVNYDLVDAQLCRRTLDRLVGFSLSPLLTKLEGLPVVDFNLGTGRVQSVIVRLAVDREEIIAKQLENLGKLDSATNPFSCNGLHLVPLEGADGAEGLVEFEMDSSLERPTITPTSTLEGGGGVSTTAAKPEKVTVDTRGQAETLAREIISCQWSLTTHKITRSFSKPSAPFTTSSLGSEAHNKFGFTMKQTMAIAQKLYERGLITYMRTDSPTLSDVVLEGCKQFIEARFGEEIHQQNQYTAKTANAQEAHEAVRPTNIETEPDTIEGTSEEKRLYGLIWRQTVASQMSKAQFLVLNLSFNPIIESYVANEGASEIPTPTILKADWILTGELRFLVKQGYLVVANPNSDEPVYDENQVKVAISKLLAQANSGNARADGLSADAPSLVSCELKQSVPSIKNRFNESSMIKELERLEIGRPSTYASLLNRVKEHKYLEVNDVQGVEVPVVLVKADVETMSVSCEETTKKVGNQKGRLVPTELGAVVTSFLVENFPQILSYQFTKEIEADLDKIARGEIDRISVLKTFWGPFHQTVNEYIKVKGITMTPSGATKDEHGMDSRFWTRLYALTNAGTTYTAYQGKTKIGRCLRLEGGEKSVFLDWKSAAVPEKSETEELLAKKLLGSTKHMVGDYQVCSGRYGLYVETKDGRKVNLPDESKIEELDAQSISTMIEEKDKKLLRTVGPYQIRDGPYGPYILVPPKEGTTSKVSSKTKRSSPKPTFVSVSKEYIERVPELTVELIQDMIKSKNEYLANNKGVNKAKPKSKSKRTN